MTTLVRLAACIVTVIGVMGLWSCETTGSMDTGPRGLEALMGDWVLDQIGGDDVLSLLPEGAQRPDLTVDEDGRIGGFAGINRYNGSLALGDLGAGVFAVGPMATTRMAGPAPLMELESRVLQGIERTTRYRIDGRTLTLSDDHADLLRFTR
jgi:heat shock protein HslJ